MRSPLFSDVLVDPLEGARISIYGEEESGFSKNRTSSYRPWVPMALAIKMYLINKQDAGSVCLGLGKHPCNVLFRFSHDLGSDL